MDLAHRVVVIAAADSAATGAALHLDAVTSGVGNVQVAREQLLLRTAEPPGLSSLRDALDDAGLDDLALELEFLLGDTRRAP